MEVQFIFYSFLSLLLSTSATKLSSLLSGLDYELEILKMETCNNSWNQVALSGFSKVKEKNVMKYNYDLLFKSALQKVMKGSVTIRKCRESASLSMTCDNFGTVRFGDEPCGYLKDEHAFWTPIVDASSPKLHCPFQGDTTYKIRNATFDMQRFKSSVKVPLDTAVWSTEFTLVDQDGKDFMCAKSDTRIVAKSRS